MKRLPLILIVLITAISLVVLLPIMLLQWLLGGNKPFDAYSKAATSICFEE